MSDEVLKGKVALAYMAGIMDGEGCVCICKGRDSVCRRGYHIYLEVTVGNTNEWLIQWLKLQFGGTAHKTLGKRNQRDWWTWSVSANKSVEFLKSLLPYLQIKRPQAELAIQFQSKMRHRSSTGLTDKEAAEQEGARLLMRKYNGRGRNAQT